MKKSKRNHKLSKSSLIARHSKESLKGNKLEGNPRICAAEINVNEAHWVSDAGSVQ